MRVTLLLLLPYLVFATSPPPGVTPCTVGNNTPCLPSSTCTPTMISTTGQPWLGQCIATPTPPIISATPPILTITDPRATPPTSTECHVGWENQCNYGSTCTPTMTCHRLLPCGGKCIATPTPAPPASSSIKGNCNVGWENECGASSTCTPIETCYRLRPCRGSCIQTATPSAQNPITYTTPPVISAENPITYISASVPVISAENPISYFTPPVITPSPSSPGSGACSVGWENQCGSGSTCTPVETCYRLRPCKGSCIPTATPVPPRSCSVGWENQCNSGSTCTPTQTCVRGRPCGGACIATATAGPSSACP